MFFGAAIVGVIVIFVFFGAIMPVSQAHAYAIGLVAGGQYAGAPLQAAAPGSAAAMISAVRSRTSFRHSPGSSKASNSIIIRR